MSLKNLLVMGVAVMGLVASVRAAIVVGTGETLRSTSADLDAWRTENADGSVVYTADIELAGGTFVFDDVVPGDFTGRVTGTGSLVFNNQEDFLFRDGTGLQTGSTVDVSFLSVHTLYLAPGNIFGAASRVAFNSTLVRTIEAAGGLIFPEGQEVHLNGCACYGQGQTWEFHGPLVLDGAMSFAEGGQFNIGGSTAGNGCYVNAYDVVLDFAGASFSSGTFQVRIAGTSRVLLGGVDDSAGDALEIVFYSGESSAQLDLCGQDCTIRALASQNGAIYEHVTNSGNGPATLRTTVAGTYLGTVDPGVMLDAAAGSVFAAERLMNDGLMAREGTVSVKGADGNLKGVRARYVRFTVDKIRTVAIAPTQPRAGSIVAFAEFVLLAGEEHLPWPQGATATQLKQTEPAGTCGADKLIDGDTLSKHCVKMAEDGFSVVFDLQLPTTFTGYRWYTADDCPERDPMAWTVEVSDDGTTWQEVDKVEEGNVEITRRAVAATRPVSGEYPLGGLVVDGYRLVTGPYGCLDLGSFMADNLDITDATNLTLRGTSLAWNESFASYAGTMRGTGTIRIAGDAETVHVPFACSLPWISFRNETGKTCTVVCDDPTTGMQPTGGRYIRFNVQRIAQNGGSGIGWGTVVALSEFELLRGGEKIDWPEGAVVQQQVPTSDPGICGAMKVIDGDLGTKHCVEMQGEGFCLQFDLGTYVEFDGYRWYTANDAEWRDPIDWTLEISNDGVTWEIVDTVVDSPRVTARNALAAERTFGVSGTVNAFDDTLRLGVESTFTLVGVSETVAGLVGNGTVNLGAEAELIVNVPAGVEEPVFSGKLACEGTFVKDGAGTQRVTGRVACGKLVLRGGVLDVRGAMFAPGVEIVLAGGRIYGRSGMTVLIR